MPLKCDSVIQLVKDKVAAADPASRTILAVFQVSITVGGKEAQQWTMDLKALKVYEGASKVPVDVSITIDDEAIMKISNNELSQADALSSGKLKFEGDVEAMKKFTALVKKIKDSA